MWRAIAVNPTAKSSSTAVHTMYEAGNAAPLPAAMPIGKVPATTVSGAAAATTMNTIAVGPSLPASRWCC